MRDQWLWSGSHFSSIRSGRVLLWIAATVADRLGSGVERVLSSAAYDHAGAELYELLRQSEAKPGSTAGYQRGSPF
jgi:hypothetical protein